MKIHNYWYLMKPNDNCFTMSFRLYLQQQQQQQNSFPLYSLVNSLLLQTTLFIPTLDITKIFVKMTIWQSRILRLRGNN